MHRKGLVVAFLAGAFTAVALMILFTAGEEVPRAMAQEQPPTLEPVSSWAQPGANPRREGSICYTVEPGLEALPEQKTTETVEIRAVPAGEAHAAAAAPRYQIATWAHPAAYSGAGASSGASHGAYILDTQDGEVWMVDEAQRPKMIQKVGKVGAE